ncbi:MAG: lytic transglycosylase domain-containing protein [Magnetococcales bacterium]|nr:lytic transglycosylase domain-containing protein [Magnetococcales bacterium]
MSTCVKIWLGFLVWLLVTPAMAGAVEEDTGKRASELFAILESGGPIDAVLDRSRWPKQDLLVSYLEWELLFHPRYKATTERLLEFLHRWPDHAQADRVQAMVELRTTRDGTDDEVLAWYDRSPPKSQRAQLRYLYLLLEKKRFQDALPLWKPLYLEGVAFADDIQRRVKPLERQLTLAEREIRARKLLFSGPQQAYEQVLEQLPAARQAYFRTLDAALHGQSNFESVRSQLPPAEASDPEIWDAQAKFLHHTSTRQSFTAFILGKNSMRLSPKLRQTFRFQIGRDLYNEHKLAAAIAVLRANILEAGGKLPDSLWLAAWSAYLQGDRRQALAWFGQLAQEAPPGSLRAQGGVWAAKLSATPEEKNKWLTMAAQYPESFYGLLAQEQLTGSMLLLPTDPYTCPTTWGSALEPRLADLRLLQTIGKSYYNGPEIRKLAAEQSLSQNDQLCLAKELGAADLAVQLASSLRKGNGPISLSGLYPLPDWKPSRGWALDPALVWSMTRQESLFFRRAESPTKAFGLMQLMPETAAEESNRIGLLPATRHLLQFPDYNLSVGQSYLARMLRMFEGDLVLAVASYNAGPGRGLSWRANREQEDPIDFIERIPFAETREYVKRVLHGWAVYRIQLHSPASLETVLREKKPGLAMFMFSKAE